MRATRWLIWRIDGAAGLIDVHTHLTMNTDFDPYHEVTSTDAKKHQRSVNARTTLMAALPPCATWEPMDLPT